MHCGVWEFRVRTLIWRTLHGVLVIPAFIGGRWARCALCGEYEWRGRRVDTGHILQCPALSSARRWLEHWAARFQSMQDGLRRDPRRLPLVQLLGGDKALHD